MFSVIPILSEAVKTLNLTLTRKDLIQEILKKYDVSKDSLQNVMKLLKEDMDRGLSSDLKVRDNSPIKMLPTYVRHMPDGKESGDFLALDLGGTNFRVLLVQVLHGKVHMESEVFPLDQTLMTSDAVTLFDYIADCIKLFVRKKKLGDKTLPLGFTFSFPVEQDSLTSGRLIRWTKGFSAVGVEGNNVVQLLKEALNRKGDHSVDVVALVNDTTGTMMACGFDDPNVIAGLILGTGTNACYMESLDNVLKWNEERETSNQVIINTEWGAFGDSGVLNWLMTEHDRTVDAESINPEQQLFEKMISGMYLGELVRQVCMDFVDRGLLFNGTASNKFKTKGAFLTKFVSDIESDDGANKKLKQVLKELDMADATPRDQDIIKKACAAVSRRAARLAAAGLATIVERSKSYNSTIAIDGTLFKKHPNFKRYMQEALRELLPQSNLKLMLSEDGSGKGAALIAAVASKTAKEHLVNQQRN